VQVAEVDALPQQRAGFLGPDAGAEGQGDVGAYPGTVARLEESRGLVEGEGLAGPAGLTFGGLAEFGVVDRGVAAGPGGRAGWPA
jgi:hypothetical protein